MMNGTPRLEVVAAAAQLFWLRTVPAVSLDEVLESSSLPKGSFNYLLDSKRTLVKESIAFAQGLLSVARHDMRKQIQTS